MSLETVPKDLRNLRACLLCSLVKTFEQFEFDGCENCEEFLHMKNNRDAVYECTSANFDGTGNELLYLVHPSYYHVSKCRLLAMMSPEDSWVAKWQRIERFTRGCYAVSVTGHLPPGIVSELRAKGRVYNPRDTSERT